MFFAVSEPSISIEDDHLPLIGDGSQLVMLVRDILQCHYFSIYNDRIVVPETLG
jgi:hypothetical protein